MPCTSVDTLPCTIVVQRLRAGLRPGSPGPALSGRQLFRWANQAVTTALGKAWFWDMLRNLWGGRAQTLFNGGNPWGKRDADAPMSTTAMSAVGRGFPDLGRKMLFLRPLSG